MPAVDMTNKTFEYLTVISRSENDKHGNARWACKCKCGKPVVILGASLRSGLIKSCGCYHKEKVTKHGMYGTPTYKSWDAMKRRCLNSKSSDFANYGGRGISIHKKWLGVNGFSSFLSDMGVRPEGETLDRIENNLNYSPENCKWSTVIEQNRNKRNCRLITHGNDTLTRSEWSLKLGGNINMVAKRIKAGWSDEMAVTTPCLNKSK